MVSPAVPYLDNPAGGTAGDVAIGLDRQHQAIGLPSDLQNVHPGNVEQRIRAGAPARVRTTPTVLHVGVLRIGCLVAADPEGPDTPTWLRHAHRRPRVTHAQIRRARNVRG
jgi:hypothetical protein